MTNPTDRCCPLCNNQGPFTQVVDAYKRIHHHCPKCMLVFTDPLFHISDEEEKDRYLEHNNGPQHPGYVEFLNQAINPALPYLSPDMTGLDYGCGPNPTLSVLLEQKGISCDIYDPYFYPVKLTKSFDFIFSTECFEHFSNPDKELKRLKDLLNPGGYLTIMTSLWKKPDQFSNWHYARDHTHISFYHDSTFHYICEQYGFELIHNINHKVIILKNKAKLSDNKIGKF